MPRPRNRRSKGMAQDPYEKMLAQLQGRAAAQGTRTVSRLVSADLKRAIRYQRKLQAALESIDRLLRL